MNHLTSTAEQEQFRPTYHFTPVANWINDPNGLVYYAREYHLFYQYHPGSTVWGPMHWGHAVSTDLLYWTELPIALYPDELGAIFSGSAVIDWRNTAGFGAEAMVAIFTHDSLAGQRQSLAYSIDQGRTWTKYAGNPVLATPPGEKDFRDPKVFWYAQEEAVGHWVMLLAVQDSIWFYTSPDLKQWMFAGEFGADAGSHAGVWETPDLFLLPVDDGAATRWVLTVGIGYGAPVTEQYTQYFVGSFDGFIFTNENPAETILRADYGPDFYAAQGWNDAPDGRKLWLAWLNNWIYANQIPTGAWRGAMSLPRELGLTATTEGIRLVQQPVAEYQSLRRQQWSRQDQVVEAGKQRLDDIQGTTLEIMAEFQVDDATSATTFGVRVRVGANEATVIGYDVQQQQLWVDRTRSGQCDFNSHFAALYRAPLSPIANTLRLHILVDRSSVEVFGNQGAAAITALIFPAAASVGVELFAEQGQVLLRTLDVYALSETH